MIDVGTMLVVFLESDGQKLNLAYK